MLWLTWRQHRMQVLLTAALLAVLGAVLLISLGMSTPAPRFAARELLGWLPLLAPAAIGAFWGAPLLAREFEHGTHQLTWTQSVTRRRWLAAKIGGLGAAVTLGGLVLAGIVTLWLAASDPPYDVDYFSFGLPWFRLVGVLPAAWWLSAFVFGVATGALFRRTLPAMAVTLAVCALAFFGLLRAPASYATPERAVQAKLMDELAPEDSLHVNDYWIDRSGVKLTHQEVALALAGPCGTHDGTEDGTEETIKRYTDNGTVETNKKYAECSFSHGYRRVTEFHPANRFWRFQWTEAGILLIPALALGGVAVRRTLRPSA